jgi:hypothetical protein
MDLFQDDSFYENSSNDKSLNNQLSTNNYKTIIISLCILLFFTFGFLYFNQNNIISILPINDGDTNLSNLEVINSLLDDIIQRNNSIIDNLDNQNKIIRDLIINKK